MARKKFGENINRVISTINSPTLRQGFSPIDIWATSPNYAMNRLCSGRFNRGFLFGRNCVLYGESGSGKSLFCAAIAASAQKEHDAFVIWIDTENATNDEAGKRWLERAGMSLDEKDFLLLSASSLEEIKKIIAKTCIDYKNNYGGEDVTEMPPLVIVVDSWASALTESEVERTSGKKAGELVGDMGQKAKQLGIVLNSVTHLCGGIPVLVLGVQHIMDNQDGYGRKHKITGGNKMLYFASLCLLLTKKQLRLGETDSKEVVEYYDDLEKNMSAEEWKNVGKDKMFVGISSVMEIIKSRVSKPFKKIEIQIPYETGIDPYSGLFSLLSQEGVITTSSQGWYEYKEENNEVVKFRKKDFLEHADRLMQLADLDLTISDDKEVKEEEDVE